MRSPKGSRPVAPCAAARLADIATLAELKRERKMRTLMRSAAARSATLQDLQRLSTPEPLPENNPELWRVTLHHARWTENLRRSLNITLARQTAEWIAAREAAAKSVGQCAVLQHLGRQTAPRARD